MTSLFIVALTGGIGSGKSTVAKLFQNKGINVVDADAIAHRLTAPGGIAIPAIARRFGAEVIEADGRMNRGMMRQRVFANPAEKKALEGILHPLIRQESEAALAATQSAYAIVDVPLLAETAQDESSWAKKANAILVVDCPIETQIERVLSRSAGQMNRQDIEAIINKQASRQARLEIATDIIDNTGSVEQLQEQVKSLNEKYLRLSSQRL